MIDNDKTHVWADSTGGLSIWEVGDVLGRGTTDLGQLCGDRNAGGTRVDVTNKWAKYKPFRYNSWGFAFNKSGTTPDLRQPARLTALRSVNCGLAMRKYAGSDAAWTAGIALADGGTDWIYVPPRGYASSEPYRLLDFDGYDRTMAAPFQYGPDPNPAFKNSTVRINDAAGGGVAEIDFADLLGQNIMVDANYGYFELSSYNIYTMLAKRTGSSPAAFPTYIYAQGSAIPNNMLSDGTWDCVTVFTDRTFTDGYYQAESGDFILAPVGRRSFVYNNNLGLSGSMVFGTGVLNARLTLNARQRIVFSANNAPVNPTVGFSIKYRLNRVETTDWYGINIYGGTINAGGSADFDITVPAPYYNDNGTEFTLKWDATPDGRWYTVQGTIVG